MVFQNLLDPKKDENLQDFENKKGKDPVFKDKNGGLS
jgi:hypothetical protein